MATPNHRSKDQLRVPRAKIPVSVMEGPVYYALIGDGEQGLISWGLIAVINVLAHRQGSGDFREPLPVVAARLGVSAKILQAAVERVGHACEVCDTPAWLEIAEGGRLRLTVYEEWNPRQGGPRTVSRGPGRKQDAQPANNLPSQVPELATPRCEQDAQPEHIPVSVSESNSRSEPVEVPETNAPTREAAPDSVSTRALARGSSVSDSTEPGGADRERTERLKARVIGLSTWTNAVAPMLGRIGDKRHPVGSPQHKADVTVSRSMFDDTIWPAEIPAADGQSRLATAIKLASTARRNAADGKPMAYLTTLLHDQLPALTENHINESRKQPCVTECS